MMAEVVGVGEDLLRIEGGREMEVNTDMMYLHLEWMHGF